MQYCAENSGPQTGPVDEGDYRGKLLRPAITLANSEEFPDGKSGGYGLSTDKIK
jgi:hypothetical protein